MRTFTATLALLALAATSQAQEHHGLVVGSGGVATTSEGSSGEATVEVGYRVAPHLVAFGHFGTQRNIQPSFVQPFVDTTVAALDAMNLQVVATPQVKAYSTLGGLRYEFPTGMYVTPYVFGALGMTRLSSSAAFAFTSGVAPDGTKPTAGQDITDLITNGGYFTPPASSTSFATRLGGGVLIPIGARLAADVRYAWAHVNSATPINAGSLMFGVGVRF
jgi:hypothetical protein